MHMHQHWLCDFLRPVIIVLYYIDISIPSMSLFILIVLVMFVSITGYTFCRASKDKSETDFLITIPYFSPRIYLILDREGIAPTIFVPMSLFCGLLRTSSTAHHLHYNLPTYFPRRIHNIVHNSSFFNICKVGICCTGI